ncbi:carbonate dehydratase [Basidiobolus meristosporus CBS 931.73]|uniref:Carbonic anhydrase n=1 Tax=Basidiobolus meristosporus CBS 931.73 TaxID=1314790 RepID=A0A1Y1Y0P2_9FUNG|nr:carbonate dehydratase [Basidiobolus meristosporus CBS 931.73]|eukprot:ORX91529.1 carbonate dehydratase [Basidiobolus meristosporus CBS 931.73]
MDNCLAKKAFLKPIFQKNSAWSAIIQESRNDFFIKSALGQTPSILWLGCSDSRVPPEVIVQYPGDMFVHRNIANICPRDDLSCMSVIQYAVEVLKVKHIIVCGHYGCGGVRAAIHEHSYGLIDGWLDNIKKVISGNSKQLENIRDAQMHEDLVVELNVANSISNIIHSSFIQKAWQKDQLLSVHGLCYDLQHGLLSDLDLDFDGPNQSLSVDHLIARKSGAKYHQEASR